MRPKPDQILDYREYPILYVDDEQNNLRLLQLSFKQEFCILTAESGEQGLERLNSEPIAVVLSDHRMPGMSGVEFLTRAREMDPKTVRILVTAYGDAETLSQAINNGAIYRYVSKPWRPEEMRISLRQAIEAYAVDREREQLVRELGLLNRVSKSLTQELEFDPLIELLLETLTRELGYDAATILFFDREAKSLSRPRFAPADSPVAEALEDLVITEDRCAQFIRSLRDGRAQRLSIADVFEMPGQIRNWITEVAAEHTLVVPLVGKARVLGALAVDNRRGGKAFTADDKTLLEGLANQAVIAIENARLVEDLRRSREEIRRADRLGTLGTLAAGLAHEINNPLTSVHTFLSMAAAKRNADDAYFWGEYHQLACHEAERIRGLVRTMRSLGQDDRGNGALREPFDVVELADEVAKLVQREAERARVELIVEQPQGLPKLVAARDHIHQVLVNLLMNALYATPPGGSVRVELAAGTERDELCITVADTGGGISEENLSQIFDPFFSTKDPESSSGLGLMICHRIVQDHGGTIEVQSQLEVGTRFTVRLPREGAS